MANRQSLQVVPRRVPSQRRSMTKVEFVLEAAARILEERGMEGFNTNAVAGLAGISVGSFYQYFPRKEAVTVALIVRGHNMIVDCLTSLLVATADMDIDSTLHHLIASLIDVQSRSRKLSQILEREEERLPRIPDVIALETRILELNCELIGRHLDLDRLTPKDLTVASVDMICVARSMLDSALNHDDDETDLHERLFRTLKGYLAPLLR